MLESQLPILERAQERAIGQEQIKRLQRAGAKLTDAEARKRLACQIADLEKTLPPVLAEPRLLLDDATTQFVATTLAEQDGRIGIVSEEAGTLLAVMQGRYSNDTGADLDIFLKAYDGGQIRVGRISRPAIVIERPALSIIITPQPSILDRIGDDEDLRGRGLLARFCWILPESRVGTRLYRRQAQDYGARAAYGDALAAILRLPTAGDGAVPHLRLEGGALDVWITYQDRIEAEQREGGGLAGIRDWASKHAGRVARIAGLFHLVRHCRDLSPWEKPISVDDMTAACTVGEWLEAHALAAFGRIGADPVTRRAKQILAWVRRHHLDHFSLKQLHDHHRDVGRADDFLPPLRMLESRHFLRSDPPPERRGAGRKPSPSFTVNPNTHAHNSQNSRNGQEVW